MQNNRFYRFGQLIFRLRWVLIGLWLVIVLACLPFLQDIVSPFKSTGFIDKNAESTKTQNDLNNQLGFDDTNKFIILYQSKTLSADNPVFLAEIKKSLKSLHHFPVKAVILYPNANNKQIAKDKHSAYAVIIFKSLAPLNEQLIEQFKSSLLPPLAMSMTVGGEPIFVDSVSKQTQTDLFNADYIAAPVSIITLILVFGSVTAALVPIVLGGSCALIILTTLFFLGHAITLSIFTINIALLLGLCLSLDYSLFIISRFRDELRRGAEIVEAIAITQATAGKAILFSGLAVFASLSALLLFPINILFSVAVGGLTAVCIAVFIAIVLLPAILSVMNHRINFLSLSFFQKNKKPRASLWHWLAVHVVKRPVILFITILSILLLLGFPFLSLKIGISDYRIFPEHSKHRQFFDTYSKEFDQRQLNPILLVVKTQKGSILSQNNLAKLIKLTKTLKRNSLIKDVNSLVTVDSHFTKTQYHALYTSPSSSMPVPIKKLLSATTSHNTTVITITSKFSTNASQTKMLIDDLRHLQNPPGMTLQLSGTPVSNFDLQQSIYHLLPWAMLWIIIFTYLILLLLLRSLFLPLKAIIMNLLSLSACYGALVLVFQEGYLHQLLNFEPQGMLDISSIIIIFCALFGFSMDYEVFLLTRIKECYEETGSNEKSIIFGIEKSSRIITSAALIVIVICGAFLVADVLMVKAFGLGIAVAIFVDAFLIRTILVPTTMTLLKHWNWYLPKWLNKILPHI